MTLLSTRFPSALSDRYVIERELGAGGMATVYLARDVKHERDVALKVLRPELGAVLGAERFLAEIRISARLDHPHILTLIDSGESNGLLWFVMPFVRGESLRDRLTRERQLGLDESLAIVRQVASALSYAHRQGVVHRDIKPENILLQEGEAMLADFGIALAVKEAGGNRLTETGLSLGTPQYMSPEQATGDRTLDARSDVYSLAAVLYEMLAGEPPVTGATVQAMIAKLLTERPTPLRVVRDTVPVVIDAAVAKALSKVPADRFSGANEFAAALEVPATDLYAAHGATVNATSQLSSRMSALWPRVSVGVLLVAVIVLGVLQWRTGTHAPDFDVANVSPTQLTFTGNVGIPSLSQDGQTLAYEQRECDSAGSCTSSLVVRDVSGSGMSTPLRGFNSVLSFGWNPNGRSLLVLGSSPDRRFGWYLVPALGGAAPRFVTAADYLFAFGTGDSLLAARPNPDSSVTATILTTADGREHESMPLRVPGYALRRVSISLDGKWFALQGRRSRDAGVRLFIADRRGVVRDSLEARGLDWDDAGHLYVSRTDSLDLRLSLVRRHDIDDKGHVSKRSVLVLSPIEIVEWGATRHGIVYTTGPSANVIYAVTRASPTSNRMSLRRLFASTGELLGTISPDGARMAIVMNEAGDARARYRWFTMPFDSGALSAMTAPIERPSAFKWTVDGRRFLYVGHDGEKSSVVEIDMASGRPHVIVSRADTSVRYAFTPLSTGGFAESPKSTPPRLRFHDASGKVTREITLGFDPVGLAESPQGGRLAAWGWSLPPGDSLVIGTLDPSDTQMRQRASFALEGASGLHWLRDDLLEMAVLETNYSSAIYHLNITSGRMVRVAGIPVINATNVNFSRDGLRGLINVQESRTDVWLARIKP